jgi:putative flippase GtrA
MNTGLVLGFFLNRHFTFGVKNKKVLRFSAYVLLGYSSQGISTLLLYLLTMRLSPGLSKIISVLCIAVYNFTVCRLLIFKDKQT